MDSWPKSPENGGSSGWQRVERLLLIWKLYCEVEIRLHW